MVTDQNSKPIEIEDKKNIILVIKVQNIKMTGCSDQIFVKGYEFLSFARNMGKKIGKNISKNLSDKCSQKPLDHTKQSATEN